MHVISLLKGLHVTGCEPLNCCKWSQNDTLKVMQTTAEYPQHTVQLFKWCIKWLRVTCCRKTKHLILPHRGYWLLLNKGWLRLLAWNSSCHIHTDLMPSAPILKRDSSLNLMWCLSPDSHDDLLWHHFRLLCHYCGVKGKYLRNSCEQIISSVKRLEMVESNKDGKKEAATCWMGEKVIGAD